MQPEHLRDMRNIMTVDSSSQIGRLGGAEKLASDVVGENTSQLRKKKKSTARIVSPDKRKRSTSHSSCCTRYRA